MRKMFFIICVIMLCFSCIAGAQETGNKEPVVQPQCSDWLTTVSNALLSQQRATIQVEAEKQYWRRQHDTLTAEMKSLHIKLEELQKRLEENGEEKP